MIYLELLLTFLKIGAFTFGGGYAMLPLIQAEVKSHGWLDTAELVDFIAVSESTPGPFAVNISTFVGMRTAGIPGALCATFGVVLPSFLIIVLRKVSEKQHSPGLHDRSEARGRRTYRRRARDYGAGGVLPGGYKRRSVHDACVFVLRRDIRGYAGAVA